MAFGIRGGCLEEEEPELSLKEAFQIEGDSANQGMVCLCALGTGVLVNT